jgi:hypothetical protein
MIKAHFSFASRPPNGGFSGVAFLLLTLLLLYPNSANRAAYLRGAATSTANGISLHPQKNLNLLLMRPPFAFFYLDLFKHGCKR